MGSALLKSIMIIRKVQLAEKNEVYVFSIKYRCSDILLKKHKLHLSRLFCCILTFYYVNMVSVTLSCYITSATRYRPRFQSRSSMYIRGLIPRNFAELAEAIPIGKCV